MSEYVFSPGPVFTQLIYDYTCTASKSSIDTNVDGPMARLFPTDGALLEVWLYARTDEAAILSVIDFTFNNDTGANYDAQLLRGQNTTASAGHSSAQTNAQVITAGASALTSGFGLTRISFPAYGDTVGFKVCDVLNVIPDSSTSSENNLYSFTWRSTSALTRLKVAPDTAGKNFVTGTRLLVYRR